MASTLVPVVTLIPGGVSDVSANALGKVDAAQLVADGSFAVVLASDERGDPGDDDLFHDEDPFYGEDLSGSDFAPDNSTSSSSATTTSRRRSMRPRPGQPAS